MPWVSSGGTTSPSLGGWLDPPAHTEAARYESDDASPGHRYPETPKTLPSTATPHNGAAENSEVTFEMCAVET